MNTAISCRPSAPDRAEPPGSSGLRPSTIKHFYFTVTLMAPHFPNLCRSQPLFQKIPRLLYMSGIAVSLGLFGQDLTARMMIFFTHVLPGEAGKYPQELI